MNQPGAPKQLKQKCYVFEHTGACAGGTRCKFSHSSLTSHVQLLEQMVSQQMDPPQKWTQKPLICSQQMQQAQERWEQDQIEAVQIGAAAQEAETLHDSAVHEGQQQSQRQRGLDMGDVFRGGGGLGLQGGAGTSLSMEARAFNSVSDLPAPGGEQEVSSDVFESLVGELLGGLS